MGSAVFSNVAGVSRVAARAGIAAASIEITSTKRKILVQENGPDFVDKFLLPIPISRVGIPGIVSIWLNPGRLLIQTGKFKIS